MVSSEIGSSHLDLHMLPEDRKQMRPQNSFAIISLQNPRIHFTYLSNPMLGSTHINRQSETMGAGSIAAFSNPSIKIGGCLKENGFC